MGQLSVSKPVENSQDVTYESGLDGPRLVLVALVRIIVKDTMKGYDDDPSTRAAQQ